MTPTRIALSLASLLSLFTLLPLGCDSSDVVAVGSDAQAVSCSADSDCPAGQACAGGFCTSDPGCQPVAEVCNGVDDDCDSVVDDGATCAAGQVCSGGACVPDGACVPSAEVCNGVDDDCDGLVDQAADCGVGFACVAGQCQCADPSCAEPCGSDQDCAPDETCQNGLCVPGGGCVPAPEACNGVDDDCDGLVDDGATCAQGQQCLSGQCVICQNGACGTPCASDADCDPSQSCVNGMCQ